MEITNMIQTATAVGGITISLVTLLIITTTLKETVELNKKQYDLIKIESNRAAREIRPEFIFDIGDSIGVRLKFNQARNISTVCTVNMRSRIVTEPPVYKDFLYPEHGILIAEGYGTEPESDDHIGNWQVDISIEYQDEDGRRYVQKFKRFPPQRAFRGSYDETYPPTLIS